MLLNPEEHNEGFESPKILLPPKQELEITALPLVFNYLLALKLPSAMSVMWQSAAGAGDGVGFVISLCSRQLQEAVTPLHVSLI